MTGFCSATKASKARSRSSWRVMPRCAAKRRQPQHPLLVEADRDARRLLPARERRGDELRNEGDGHRPALAGEQPGAERSRLAHDATATRSAFALPKTGFAEGCGAVPKSVLYSRLSRPRR